MNRDASMPAEGTTRRAGSGHSRYLREQDNGAGSGAAPAGTTTTTPPPGDTKAGEGKGGAPAPVAKDGKAEGGGTPAPKTEPKQEEKPKTFLGSEPPKDEKDAQGGKPASESSQGKPDAASSDEVEVTVPEGVPLNAEALSALKAIAKEAKVGSAAAQKLVDLHVKVLQDAQAAAEAALQQRSAEWRKAIENDKELGGANLKATLANATRALQQFATPGLRAVLEEFRLGDHPEMVRFVAAIGDALAEDRVGSKGTGGAPGAALTENEQLARALYAKTMFKDE